MPRARRNFAPLYVDLTDGAVARIDQIAKATDRTASDVVDEAIRRYLRASRDGENGIQIPPVDGALVKHRYNIEPDTDARLRAARERLGLRLQDVARAAIEGHLDPHKG